ncbi:MAG: protein kinase, partial [Myxococcota bacterium]
MAIEFPAPACDGLEAEVVRRAVAQRLFGTEAGPVCIGRYEIVEQLGAGGTGIVYAARDPTLDRSVAIKVLNHHIPASQRSRLSTEARVLAQVVHPNVVAVYDVDLDYIVMERVDGLDLAQWLASP